MVPPFSTSVRRLLLALSIIVPVADAAHAADAPPKCETTVKADVVALDQAFQVNRLGTTRTDGEIYALRADVVSNDPATSKLLPGRVMLRPDKRPRPMVLRVNAGSCLEITFTNLLDPQ